jgi:hypothetical protein
MAVIELMDLWLLLAAKYTVNFFVEWLSVRQRWIERALIVLYGVTTLWIGLGWEFAGLSVVLAVPIYSAAGRDAKGAAVQLVQFVLPGAGLRHYGLVHGDRVLEQRLPRLGAELRLVRAAVCDRAAERRRPPRQETQGGDRKDRRFVRQDLHPGGGLMAKTQKQGKTRARESRTKRPRSGTVPSLSAGSEALSIYAGNSARMEEARDAYERADAWARSEVGTPYGRERKKA